MKMQSMRFEEEKQVSKYQPINNELLKWRK